MPKRPELTPPGATSPSLIRRERHQPAERHETLHGIDLSVEVPVVATA